MEEILAMLLEIDWLCNDLHYAASENFYQNHLLADKIRNFGTAADDINEQYYLGFKNSTPPIDAQIATRAISLYDKSASRNDSTLCALAEAFILLSAAVENAKREEGIPGGIHAILDDISCKALTYKFFVSSSIPHAEVAES